MVLRDLLPGQVIVVVYQEADDIAAFFFIAGVDAGDIIQFPFAGAAPGGKDVHHGHFALRKQLGGGNGVPVQVRGGESEFLSGEAGIRVRLLLRLKERARGGDFIRRAGQGDVFIPVQRVHVFDEIRILFKKVQPEAPAAGAAKLPGLFCRIRVSAQLRIPLQRHSAGDGEDHKEGVRNRSLRKFNVPVAFVHEHGDCFFRQGIVMARGCNHPVGAVVHITAVENDGAGGIPVHLRQFNPDSRIREINGAVFPFHLFRRGNGTEGQGYRQGQEQAQQSFHGFGLLYIVFSFLPDAKVRTNAQTVRDYCKHIRGPL